MRQSLGAAERQLGHSLQIHEYPSIKRDYFVPNFGEDADIEKTQASENLAQKLLGHTWTPEKDEDGNWKLPSP